MAREEAIAGHGAAYDAVGMRDRTGPTPWATMFAIGLLVRPLLIVPMAPGGPLRASELLPIALLAVFAAHVLFAAGVYLGFRPMIALGVLTAVAGIPLALIGLAAGLPMPWPAVVAVYNAALLGIGVAVWQGSTRRSS